MDEKKQISDQRSAKAKRFVIILNVA
jgi:hypothetical protein